ncbi:hypothetical protein D3C81_1737870 [compost metagenome]
MGNQLVELQATLHVEVDQVRHVHRETVGAHQRALDPALVQQRVGVQFDLQPWLDHADHGGGAAALEHAERLLGGPLEADAFE